MSNRHLLSLRAVLAEVWEDKQEKQMATIKASTAMPFVQPAEPFVRPAEPFVQPAEPFAS